MTKRVLITEEGQERLFRLIRAYIPGASDEQCLAILWGNTDAPYCEYREAKKQLDEYLKQLKND
jgi:hypothetical protein